MMNDTAKNMNTLKKYFSKKRFFLLAFSFLFFLPLFLPNTSYADIGCSYGGSCVSWKNSGFTGTIPSITHDRTFKAGDTIRIQGSYVIDWSERFGDTEWCVETHWVLKGRPISCPSVPPTSFFRNTPSRYYVKYNVYSDLGYLDKCYACFPQTSTAMKNLFDHCEFSFSIDDSSGGRVQLLGNASNSSNTTVGNITTCNFDQSYTFPNLGSSAGSYRADVYPQTYGYEIFPNESCGINNTYYPGPCESNVGTFYEHIQYTVPYTCTGTLPANTTVHSGDTTGLNANISYVYSEENTVPKCQYYCNTGYTWNGSSCVVIPKPVVDLKINGSETNISVIAGTNLTLSWSAINATSCTAIAGDKWLSPFPKSTTGTDSIYDAQNTSTYTIECTGPGGSGSDSVTVTVIPKPVVDLKINGSETNISVIAGTNLTLSWSAINATSCTAIAGDKWLSPFPKSTTGTDSIYDAQNTSTYTIECTGPGGSGTDSVPVTVTKQYTLNVSKEGPGSVEVNASPCSPLCSTKVNEGTPIDPIKASPINGNAQFMGWDRGYPFPDNTTCKNDTSPCFVVMDKDGNLNANFECRIGYTGSDCHGVEGQCNTSYTNSCYEGDLSSKTASDLCINSNFGTGGNPKYVSGKWTWTCKGGAGSVSCTTNQCARYKELNP
ncbi:MAG: hypothetical protein IPN70_04980 [Candidatus Moraniibacteriota bacterium]|nr:MAG: hypothetical protein IPN70_04980 [Candidatus Moranbacteria bacterium]